MPLLSSLQFAFQILELLGRDAASDLVHTVFGKDQLSNGLLPGFVALNLFLRLESRLLALTGFVVFFDLFLLLATSLLLDEGVYQFPHLAVFAVQDLLVLAAYLDLAVSVTCSMSSWSVRCMKLGE